MRIKFHLGFVLISSFVTTSLECLFRHSFSYGSLLTSSMTFFSGFCFCSRDSLVSAFLNFYFNISFTRSCIFVQYAIELSQITIYDTLKLQIFTVKLLGSI